MTTHDADLPGSLDDLLAPGDVVAGKYRVDRVLGQGGMGVVVQAWHLHFEEKVAIKFLLPQLGANSEALARFEREARAAFKIKSEHVVRVIDVDKLDNGAPYIVMEYLDGCDLADLLDEGQLLPVETAVGYIMQACEAVAEAHAAGIVHRDLKPENLFLTRRSDDSSCIKVLDFGLSKIEHEQGRRRERALTAQAQVMGTPHYMSPEQWMSSKDVGPATDIWALGVLLYELITLHQPFNKEIVAQLCTMVLKQEPQPMAGIRPGVHPALQVIVDNCLKKDPTERYATVGHLAAALYGFGPSSRSKASLERISGVLSAAGIETAPVPPSVAPPPLLPREHPLTRTVVMSEGEHEFADGIGPSSSSGQHAVSWRADEGGRHPSPAQLPEPQRASHPGQPPSGGPRRAETAQSWQHVLGQTQGGSRGKAVVIASVVAALLLAIGAIAVLTGDDRPTEATSAAPSGSPSDETTPAPRVGQDPYDPSFESATATAEPSVALPPSPSASPSASASASASATKKSSVPTPVVPSKRRRRRRRGGSIFDGR